MDNFIGKWLGNFTRIRRDGAHPPWALEIWDPDLWTWARVGGSPRAAGSVLLAPGGAPLAAEMVVLAGDPPDPVTIQGDFVWLRRYQPNFTVAPNGDLTVVEGL